MRRFSGESGEVRGSFTIEAAYIMPIIIFTVVALIYFILYLYNITLFESRMNEAALSVEELRLRGTDPYTKEIDYELLQSRDITYMFTGLEDSTNLYITDYIYKQNEEGYMMAHVEDVSVSAGMMELTLSADLVMDISLPKFFKFFNSNIGKTSITINKGVLAREEKQRIYTVLKDTVIQIKGVEEILEKIKSVINYFK